MPKNDQAIWVFDSVCVLCSWGVRYTLRHERAASIRFVAIQSVEGRGLAQAHGVDADDPSTFLFIEGGRVLEKSDALMALVGHLKGPAQLLRWFRWLPKGLRDAAYTLGARHRYRLFGRLDDCMVPQPDQRERFVLK